MFKRTRRGFTLVELLVVIAIIGTLVGLLLPAINAARSRARQATCVNNIRQLAIAMQSYATKGKQVFPGWASEQTITSGTASVVRFVPWTVKILAELDQQALREQILTNSNGAVFPYAEPPQLEVFLCPADANTNPKIGTLTYVVNSGMPDPVDLSGYPNSDLKANGVCHDERTGRAGPGSVRYPTDIKDGADSTLLLSENIHKDITVGTFTSSWLGPIQADDTVTPANSLLNPEQRFGMAWPLNNVNYGTGLPPDALFAGINKDPDGGNYSGKESKYMRPASAHGEVFVAAFCGGNVREMSDAIEFRVYQQLMTPNGQKAALASDPSDVIEDNTNFDKRFMSKPLNASDY